MFRSRRLPSAPDEIYSSSLETLHLGRALWYPEPHSTGEPQIGDVGYMREGAFVRLFNLDTSAPEKRVTFWPTPFENIEPLPANVFQIDSRRRPLAPDHYCSHGVETKGLHASADATTGTGVSASLSAKYMCKAAQGAVLELKSEAYAESIYESRILEKYILRHHDSWHAYVRNVLGHRVEQENLVVVSGWVKTEADWATVAFGNMSTSTSVSVEGRAGGVAGIQMGGERTSSVTGPKMHRHGEHYAENASGVRPADTKRDQCVFLRRLMLRKRPMLPRKIVAGAGHHRLPGPEDGREALRQEEIVVQEVEELDGSDIWELVGEGEAADPLNILLDYILETTNVEVAIVSDEQVDSIVGGNRLVDFASYLRQVQPPVEVDGKLGSLCLEDVISHERERAFARRAIIASDSSIWLDITFDDAGRLEDGCAFLGPAEGPARSLKLKLLSFSDSRSPSEICESFAMSKDTKLLAASFKSKEILIWRLSDGLLVQRLRHDGHTNNASSLSFSPHNCTLVSGSDDKSAIVWDIRSGRVLLRLKDLERGRQVNQVAYTPHGTLIATGARGEGSAAVKIWNASTGVCLHSFDTGADEHIYNVAFSPDSSLCYVEQDHSCRIFDIRTYTHIATLQHNSRGYYLRWSMSHQGDLIVTGSVNEQVNIWSAVTGEELLTIDHSEKLSHPVTFSADGTEVSAVCGAGRTALAVYDSRTGQLRHVYNSSNEISCVAYCPKGDYVALGASCGDVEVCDAKSWALLAKIVRGEGDGDLEETHFLSDGRTLLMRFETGPLQLCSIHDVMRIR